MKDIFSWRKIKAPIIIWPFWWFFGKIYTPEWFFFVNFHLTVTIAILLLLFEINLCRFLYSNDLNTMLLLKIIKIIKIKIIYLTQDCILTKTPSFKPLIAWRYFKNQESLNLVVYFYKESRDIINEISTKLLILIVFQSLFYGYSSLYQKPHIE